MVRVITYQSQYKDDFIRLNTQWIETYFKLEDGDRETFAHADDIVTDGGQIFLALADGGEVVGCCALKHHKDTHDYELSKMAVSPQYQGQHIGRMLGEALVDYARQHGVKSVFLEGNTRLKASIALYRRLGFQEVPLEGQAYDRCDILMRLTL